VVLMPLKRRWALVCSSFAMNHLAFWCVGMLPVEAADESSSHSANIRAGDPSAEGASVGCDTPNISDFAYHGSCGLDRALVVDPE
jgi:hypothetical protein